MSARKPPAFPSLTRAFYARPCLEVAADLLGKFLVVRRAGQTRAGRIVETEAYVGPDNQASHARRGPTPRARIMYGPPGHAYVYLIYGANHCFNVVCDREGFPAAVLLRAVEPSDGLADDGTPAAAARTAGPGKLCKALDITIADNGLDLVPTTDATVWLEDRGGAAPRIVTTPRINVDYAGDWAARPYRFVDAASRSLSRRLPRP